DGDQWLETARAAHEIGLKSNCTMLYGHVENEEDRVDHMVRLRQLQDETHGFQTFIPLAFHPENTPLQHLPKTTGMSDIKQIAIGRLMLDNIPHAKDRADFPAFWRGRYRWHRDRREDLPRCRRYHSARHEKGRASAVDPRG